LYLFISLDEGAAIASYHPFRLFPFNSRIWCHSFLAYMRVVVALHGAEHPDVMDAMVAFACDIMNYTEVYHWQFAVLPLAIAWHEQVLHTGPLVAENCKIDPLWRDLYINSAAVAKTTPAKAPTQRRSLRARQRLTAQRSVSLWAGVLRTSTEAAKRQLAPTAMSNSRHLPLATTLRDSQNSHHGQYFHSLVNTFETVFLGHQGH
jgi:hypothetical protein